MRPSRHFVAAACLFVLSTAGQRAFSARHALDATGQYLGTLDEADSERVVLARLAACSAPGRPVTFTWRERSGRFVLDASATYRPEGGSLTVSLDGQRAVYCPVTPAGIARAVTLPRTRTFTGAMASSARP